MNSKLAGWKARNLSMARRLVMAKSVLEAIPNYYLQTTQQPSSIINQMERIIWNFLWWGTNQSKKIHWASWNKVTTLKKEEGLGLLNLHQRSQACAIYRWSKWKQNQT